MQHTSPFQREINWNAVGKFSPIEKHVKEHLINVYTTLTASILCAALGSVAYLRFHIGGTMSFLAGILLMVWLAMTPKHEVNKRCGILFGFSFIEGLSLGPLLAQTIDLDPSIVTSAFLGTVCIFGSFSAAAFFAERRSYLFLGGLLGTSLTSLLVIGLFNIFFQSAFLLNLSLYVGLLVFCGFVIFDTQLIIEKASSGQKDFVWDSLELFLDFVSIFVRLLIILSKDKKKNNNNK
eukprot:TRINITY_DN727_c0_g1_i1.p1 TRINITY_DN727_c0_g1~~TRINITY_DN727_c0_g1_i1.p1  ORF type:complete len:245 (-),score=73.72 TRINITY_DN727_c0_g1_i1:108-815(-)